ncbi:uncharacterized protein LOC134062526 [Sardina pilchardus]|uniref:uncharacterized protein LOC134062526 n=1 Tax=Sardina pilchardus TaxID=27697 RepID=UPI002E11F295
MRRVTYNYDDMDWPWRKQDDAVAVETPCQAEDSSSIIVAHPVVVEFPQADLKDDAVAVETPYQGEDSSTINVAHPAVVESPQADLKDDAVAVETPYQGEDSSTITVAHPAVVESPQADLKDDAVAVETPYQGEDSSTIIVAHPVEFPQADMKDDAVAVETPYQGEDSSTITVPHPAVVESPQADLTEVKVKRLAQDKKRDQIVYSTQTIRKKPGNLEEIHTVKKYGHAVSIGNLIVIPTFWFLFVLCVYFFVEKKRGSL